MAGVPYSITADEAVNNLRAIWNTVRSKTVLLIAQCDAGSLNSDDAAGWMISKLAPYKTAIATYSAVPGVAARLAATYPGKFADEAAATTALNAFIAAHNALIVWMEDNLPQDANKRLTVLVLADDGSGTVTGRTITNQAQLDASKAQLVLYRDSIDPN